MRVMRMLWVTIAYCKEIFLFQVLAMMRIPWDGLV